MKCDIPFMKILYDVLKSSLATNFARWITIFSLYSTSDLFERNLIVCEAVWVCIKLRWSFHHNLIQCNVITFYIIIGHLLSSVQHKICVVKSTCSYNQHHSHDLWFYFYFNSTHLSKTIEVKHLLHTVMMHL